MGQESNPLRHLEALSVWLFAIATATGVYLLVLYPLSPWEAYRVVAEWPKQWVHGVIRSLHRYASELLLIVVILHGLQMALEGKFRRWVEWVTGLGLVGVLWVIGVTGFVLIWDEQAQLVGLLGIRLLVGTGLFEPGIARAFITSQPEMLGGFFRVILFAHIVLTLVLIGGIWLHTVRLARPRLVPPRGLMLWSSFLLLVMALAFPTQSGRPLGWAVVPYDAVLNPWYGAGFLLLQVFSPGVVWSVFGVVGVGLLVLPWVGRSRMLTERPSIDRERCDGCQQCILDCPYGAIVLREREGKAVADVVAERCVGCSICVGSCPQRGIQLPGVAEWVVPEEVSCVVVHCEGLPVPHLLRSMPFVLYSVPCVGGIHAAWFWEQLVRRRVAVVHCQRCWYRLGAQWMRLRLGGRRRPRLARRDLRRRLFVRAYSPRLWEQLCRWAQEGVDEVVGDRGR